MVNDRWQLAWQIDERGGEGEGAREEKKEREWMIEKKTLVEDTHKEI